MRWTDELTDFMMNHFLRTGVSQKQLLVTNNEKIVSLKPNKYEFIVYLLFESFFLHLLFFCLQTTRVSYSAAFQQLKLSGHISVSRFSYFQENSWNL